MIPSIYEAVSKMNILKGALPWTYYKLPCILSWLDLSDESYLGTGPWVLFHCQVFKDLRNFFTLRVKTSPNEK